MLFLQLCPFTKRRTRLFPLRPYLSWLYGAGLHSISKLTEEGIAVFQSQSTDIHQNLALEDWIESNVDLTNRRMFLIWRSRAAVVIGRHQNPWAECNQEAMRRAGIPLARRRSGGGTVYHDSGNLNLTFFSCRKLYDRQRNLKVVTDALRRARPELDVKATERLDIVLNGKYKISGSASRLSRGASYHHCTLLHSADGSALRSVLRSSIPGIHSNATPSVVSVVTNLTDHTPITWAELIQALVQQYNTEFGVSSPLVDLDPTDESLFPGIGRIASELRSWEWTFGKTPKFTVQTKLNLHDSLTLERSTAELHIEVKNGLMSSVDISVQDQWLPQRLLDELCGVLTEERFCPHRAAVAVSTLIRSERDEVQRRLHDLSNTVINVMG